MEWKDRQTRNERIQELSQRLEEGIRSVFASSQYREYLKAMSKFHSYSYNNSMLIHLQKPDARYVAGYKTWKSFDRHVKKGAKGIAILAPNPYKEVREVDVIDPKTGEVQLDAEGKPRKEQRQINYTSFRVISVFDISQTEGKPLPELIEELQKKTANYPLLINIIRSTAPVPIRFDSWDEEAKGYYDLKKKEIVIKTGMSESQTLKTAIHEMAHSLLHAEMKTEKSPATMEVEAESIAFIVCDHFGVDTSDYSFGYLASWSSSKELPELKASLKTIQDTSHDLIERMDLQMQRHMEQQIQKRTETFRSPQMEPETIHHNRRS